MRAAPPTGFRVVRFGVWNAVVAGLALAGIGALIGWGAGRPEPLPPLGWAAIGAGSLLAGGWLALPSLQRGPLELRWDGRRWFLGPTPEAAVGGELRVVIDLGGFLLLRFDEADDGSRARRRGRVRWLPVQRAGLEDRWHALRCAVHAPRVAERPAAGDGGDVGAGGTPG